MSAAGGFSKGAVKRTAGSDFNTGAKNTSISTDIAVKEQENRNYANPKEAFLRPAQRPPKSIVPSVSANNSKPTANQLQPQPRQLALPKRRTPLIVYSDYQPDKENQEANMKETKSIPQHSSSNKPTLTSTTSNYNSQVQSADSEQDWVTIDTEQLAPDTTKSSKPSGTHEEITEALYMDAVEELPNEKYPVAEPEKMEPSPQPSPDTTSTHSEAEAKAVGFPAPQFPSLPADDQTEPSDCEDEDYYDEQGYTTAHSYPSHGGYTTVGATTVMFPPKLTKKGEEELVAAREIVQSKRIDDEVDDDERFDISMVIEYGEEIFHYMKEVEITLLPNPHYMDTQTEIRWSMRAVLMDWVIQVHTRFGLLPETLFSAVNFIDRFLSVKIVSLGKLQLVGATALFLAAKYEEINCPSVQEVVYMVDGAYTFDEILKAERFMLSMLNFALGWPGPMSFMRRISKADEYDNEIRTVAKYFLEVALMDERFVSTPPSYVAAGAQCLSRMILGKGDWTAEHVHYSGYTYSQLKPFVGMILDCCRDPRKHHKAVFEKYMTSHFRRASWYVEQQLLGGFRLPFQQSGPSLTSGDWGDDDVAQLASPMQHSLRMPIPLLG
ncbi:B-type cyclin [Parahypoxylon ruwenzoriense]